MMMKNKKFLIGILLVGIILVAGWWVWNYSNGYAIKDTTAKCEDCKTKFISWCENCRSLGWPTGSNNSPILSDIETYICLKDCFGVIFPKTEYCDNAKQTCENFGVEAKTNPKIEDIISNLNLYSGKTVIIEGKYGGWGVLPAYCDYNKIGVATRSDAFIYDETGCIFICASCYGVEYLYTETHIDPLNETTYGTNIKVNAFVDIDNEGKPILGKIS